MTDVSTVLVDTIARKFIARRDVKAVQHPSGAYTPDRTGWRGRDVVAHLAGERTYGHYLVNTEGLIKLVCFDVDLAKTGWYCRIDDPALTPGECSPREVWRTSGHPGRRWLCAGLRVTADLLASRLYTEVGLPVAVAYSGNKGLHVYGFTGMVPAATARAIGVGVLANLESVFTPARGKSLYRAVTEDPQDPLANIAVEIYPKQDEVRENGGLGNLLRLPLGVNRASGRPGFFLDLKARHTGLVALDPMVALESGDPWA